MGFMADILQGNDEWTMSDAEPDDNNVGCGL